MREVLVLDSSRCFVQIAEMGCVKIWYNIGMAKGLSTEILNNRFGAPGRIVFRDGFAGYPNVVIANQYGSAEIALLGGTVLSYRPTGHSQVIFRPAKKDLEYNRGDSFHGGVPVCWPQFGNRFSKDLPQHGFARKMVFEVRGSTYSEEQTEITLGLRSDDETMKVWPHAFDLELTVSVTMKLNLTLTTRNTGGEPFEFSCGFHPYFLLRNRDDATVRGLDGCGYVDASGEEIVEGVQSGDVALTKGYDHIFTLPAKLKSEFAILDPGLKRAIAIAASGNGKAVVWNPGDAYVVGDHAADDWKKFVCVEPISDWPGGRALGPGEKHVLTTAIQCHLDEGSK